MNSGITTRNPWHDPHSNESRPTFSYSGRRLFFYRGVEVYKNVDASWDYVLDGVTITQRAGFTRDRAPKIIDGLLDGTDIIPVSPIVAAYLCSRGFTPNEREPKCYEINREEDSLMTIFDCTEAING